MIRCDQSNWTIRLPPDDDTRTTDKQATGQGSDPHSNVCGVVFEDGKMIKAGGFGSGGSTARNCEINQSGWSIVRQGVNGSSETFGVQHLSGAERVRSKQTVPSSQPGQSTTGNQSTAVSADSSNTFCEGDLMQVDDEIYSKEVNEQNAQWPNSSQMQTSRASDAEDTQRRGQMASQLASNSFRVPIASQSPSEGTHGDHMGAPGKPTFGTPRVGGLSNSNAPKSNYIRPYVEDADPYVK